jgi:gliding motility associated protien GldN
MNQCFFKNIFLAFLSIFIVGKYAIAQQPAKSRTIDNLPPVAKTVDTTKHDTTTDKIEYVKSTGGLIEQPKISLRNDLPYAQTFEQKVKPLPYQPLAENNVNFRVRVWRDIDGRDIVNGMFSNARQNNYGGNRFVNILLKAITEDSITAFSGDDDRFTTPLSPQQAIAAFGGGVDTVPVINMDGDIVGHQVREKPVYPEQVYKFRVKEDWLFDRNTNRLIIRIIGIAPIMPYVSSTGEVPGSEHVVFWVYYPDIRSVLTKYLAYNPKNPGSPYTWEEVFESHRYKSTIVKSDLDNGENQSISNLIPNNTQQQKAEREKIKNKILAEERRLWEGN